MNHTTIPAVKDTDCDNCSREIPKGADLVADDDSSLGFCSVTCWEDAKQEDSEQ